LEPKGIKIKRCSTVILPVVLYGRETWCLTLRDKHRLRVSENRVLSIILEPKLGKVTWDRRMHNMELYVYSSPVIIWVQIKKNEMVGAYRGEDCCIQCVCGGKMWERDHLENLGIGGIK